MTGVFQIKHYEEAVLRKNCIRRDLLCLLLLPLLRGIGRRLNICYESITYTEFFISEDESSTVIIRSYVRPE